MKAGFKAETKQLEKGKKLAPPFKRKKRAKAFAPPFASKRNTVLFSSSSVHVTSLLAQESFTHSRAHAGRNTMKVPNLTSYTIHIRSI